MTAAEIPRQIPRTEPSTLTLVRQLVADVEAIAALDPLARGSLQVALIQLSGAPGPQSSLTAPVPSGDARGDLHRALSMMAAEIAVASNAASSVALGKASRHVQAALSALDEQAPPDPMGQP